MSNHNSVPTPGNGVRPVDPDPKPSEGQDEKDLGEDEGEDKDGDQAADTPEDGHGHQATPRTDAGIERSSASGTGHDH